VPLLTIARSCQHGAHPSTVIAQRQCETLGKPGDILHAFHAPFTRDFLLAQYGPAIFDRQVVNLTGRFNVINFASLFSGTAVAPPRSVSAACARRSRLFSVVGLAAQSANCTTKATCF